MIFDDELRCKEHTYCKVKKVNAHAGMLRRSFSGFAKDMFEQLFVAMVRPHLKYEAPIWNNHSKEQIILIRNDQGMAAKQVQGISDISYKEKARSHGSNFYYDF